MNLVKKYFPQSELDAITESIRAIEKRTSGELRVEIRQQRRRNEKIMTIEQIARAEFVQLGMQETRDRTGVLIFLLLEDRQFCILADEGIHGKVGQDPWGDIAAEMSRCFKEGKFPDGVKHAVAEVGNILAAHVPRKPHDTNELPDEVGTS